LNFSVAALISGSRGGGGGLDPAGGGPLGSIRLHESLTATHGVFVRRSHTTAANEYLFSLGARKLESSCRALQRLDDRESNK